MNENAVFLRQFCRFISPLLFSTPHPHPPVPPLGAPPQQMDQWAAEKQRLHTQAAHAIHQFESVHEFDELRKQAGGGPPGVLCADTERLLLIVSGTCVW